MLVLPRSCFGCLLLTVKRARVCECVHYITMRRTLHGGGRLGQQSQLRPDLMHPRLNGTKNTGLRRRVIDAHSPVLIYCCFFTLLLELAQFRLVTHGDDLLGRRLGSLAVCDLVPVLICLAQALSGRASIVCLAYEPTQLCSQAVELFAG